MGEHIYRPTEDVLNEWPTVYPDGTDHYVRVDESTPTSYDYVFSADGTGDGAVEIFGLSGSADEFAACPMIPWGTGGLYLYQMRITVYAHYSRGKRGYLKAFLYINGTKYYAQSMGGDDVWYVNSRSMIYRAFTFTSCPWGANTLGTNWGIAPKDIAIGVEKYGSAGNLYLDCIYVTGVVGSAPGAPGAPTEPWFETYNNRVRGIVGQASSNDLVPWDVGLSAVMASNSGGCKVQVSSDGVNADMWDSYLQQFLGVYGNGERSPLIYYDGNTLQDGRTYYFRHKAVNEFSEESGWSDWNSFTGVTDSDWWDANYHRRFNIRAGTAHSALGAGYTLPFTMKTGRGKIVSATGKMNEGIQHSSRQIVYHEGFLYMAWLDTPTLSGTMICYVAKYDIEGDVLSGPVYVYDTGTVTDTHRYPSLIVTANGKLLLIQGHHDSQALIRITTNAHVGGSGIDIENWDSPLSPSSLSSCAYCRPLKASNGDLYIFFRHTFSHRGQWSYTRSSDNGATWSALRVVVYYHDYVISPPSVYCGGVGLDSNDRVHALISWWDNYGSSNRGRAVSYIYSDLDGDGEYTDWYEKEGGGTKVGERTATPNASLNVDYAACSKIATCDNPDSTLSGNYVHTNSEALVIGDSNEPYFVFYTYVDTLGQNSETPIFFVEWGGSSWTITDLYTDESLPKLWKYRQGGQLYFDDGWIHIYGFVKPSGEVDFGGEEYHYRCNLSTHGWSGWYMSANSSKGIGMMSVLDRVYPGVGRWILFVRAEDIVLQKDEFVVAVRFDGADIRVVEVDYNGGSAAYMELDRLPDAIGMEETTIQFALNTAIPADQNVPTDMLIQVYIGKYDAGTPPHDGDIIYRYREGFESYASNSKLNGQGGWAVNPTFYMTIYDSTDVSHYVNAHTNKLWDGDKFLFVGNICIAEKDLDDSLTGLGTDLTDKRVIFHIWDEGGSGRCYLELYDVTADKWIRLGMDFAANYAGYATGTTGWTNTVQLTGTRYYEFEFRINSSGVSGYVNGTQVFSGDTEITVFDKIRIGQSNAGSYMVFDQIIITDLVADEPEVSTTEANPDIKDELATARLGHLLQLSNLGSTRQAHVAMPGKTAAERLADILNLENVDRDRVAEILNLVVTGKCRQAHGLISQITTALRQAHGLTPEAEVTARLAAAMIANVLRSDRFIQSLIVEMTAGGRFDNIIRLQYAVAERCAELIIAEVLGKTRISQAILGDKNAAADIAHLASLLGSDNERIANALAAEKSADSRQSQFAILVKGELSRQAHHTIMETLGSIRQAQAAQANQIASDKMAGYFRGDKTIRSRIAHYMAFEATIGDRLAHYLGVDKTIADAIGQILLAEASGQSRVDHVVSALKNEFTRVSQRSVVESTARDRLASAMQTDKILAGRLALLMLGNKEIQTRLAQTLNFQGAHSERLANAMLAELADGSRLRHLLRAETSGRSRIAELILSQAATFARLASAAILEDTEIDKAAHMIIAEQSTAEWQSQIFVGDKIIADRLAQIVMPQMAASARVNHLVNPAVVASGRDMSLVLVEAAGHPRLAQMVRFYGRTSLRFNQIMISRQGYLSLPGGRYVEVGEEFRQLTVPAEDRGITVGPDDRIRIVQSEDRTVCVPNEDRTIVVK